MTNDKPFTFWLPSDLIEKIKNAAWLRKMSAAAFIRQAVEKELAS